ncbi:RIP metalloprotease RseP [Coraliomargarita sp. SDUM461004]|uniref:Zinc metalloprotease n=1 Tax=Thalassobacterium sedimentorum TaxID=3041258 RepID=A0ABU1AEY0_9BACT|nr:RIP metalloprotease RseP [Coraliomargarita sp. SDUM461004]MDQ8193344.1 RIP metalloprotease RseP [Coraliomargarita sp. SDUM461004]
MFSTVLYIAIALFALGFSIFIHELGHFIAAKKRGLIADRFSIGFGPRIFGWHRNGTDFRLSLLPLGGYVSLPQLADMGRIEGGEKEDADRLPPISYADKMIVAVMGAVFNLIFALVLSLVLWGVGREIVKSTTVGYVAEEIRNADGAIVPGPAYVAGIRAGDKIRTIDDKAVPDWWYFQNAIATGVGKEVGVEGRRQVEVGVLREGKAMEFTVYPELVSSERMRYIGIEPETDETSAPIVVRLEPDMPAIEAGLLPMDRLIKLDGEEIISGAFLSTYLANHGDRSIDVTVERNGKEITLPIQPRIKEGEQSPRFGFAYDFQYKTEIVHYNPIDQLYRFAETMKMTLFALVHTNSDVHVKNMSGPVGIVHGLTRMAQIGFIDLLWMLALINVNLAIFNLLPIPVLDGGHMLFATISKVIGRPLPQKVMENVQGAFMIILLGFVIYVSFFDVGRVGRDIGLIDDEPQASAETVPAAPTTDEAAAESYEP